MPAATAWSARQGLTAAAGVVAAVLAASALGLQDPWWAGLSAWVIADADHRRLWSKGLMRVVGTIAGCVLGYRLGVALQGMMAVQAVALVAVGAVGTRMRFASPYGYAWLLGAITALMVLLESLSAPAGLYVFAWSRGLEIVLGVLVGTVTQGLLGPRSVAPAAALAASPAAAAVDADLGRLSLAGGLLALSMAVLWSVFELPSLTQMAISALVVLDRDVGALHLRAGQRFLGCLTGGAMGLAALRLGVDAFPVWLAALGGGLFLFSTLHNGGGPRAYVGTQGGMALIMTLVVGSGPPDTLLPVIDRLLGVAIGAGLVVVLSWLLAPPSGPAPTAATPPPPPPPRAPPS